MLGAEQKSIILDFNDLKRGVDLTSEVETAFSNQGHGILFVSNIPGYAEARKNLLVQAWRLAHLPEQSLKALMHPEVYHSRGWSCGV